jgi:soluble lytic murein transglycosylase-like protein
MAYAASLLALNLCCQVAASASLSATAVRTPLTVPSAYHRVAKEYSVPAGILFAIALTESGRRVEGRILPYPWTLNIDGHGEYFSTRTEADARLVQLIHDGQAPDIGLMQVNWKYHRGKLGAPEQAFDPWLNLRAGALVLRKRYEETGDWWQAVGRYHSRTPSRARTYRQRVLRWYRRLG